MPFPEWCFRVATLLKHLSASGVQRHSVQENEPARRKRIVYYNPDLLLGRKVMTNLDSIFKSRDITLPTKVCLVKAMVFPVVMYGCESWTAKKAER